MRSSRFNPASPVLDLENWRLPQPLELEAGQLEEFLQNEHRDPQQLHGLLGRLLIEPKSQIQAACKPQILRLLSQLSAEEWMLCKAVLSPLLVKLGLLEQGASVLLERFPDCFFRHIHLWMPDDQAQRYSLCQKLMNKAPDQMIPVLPSLQLSRIHIYELGRIGIAAFASLELLVQLPAADCEKQRDDWIDRLARYAQAKSQLAFFVSVLPSLNPSSNRIVTVIQSAINQGLRSMELIPQLPQLSTADAFKIAEHLVLRGRYVDLRQFKMLDQEQRLALARAMFRACCTVPNWLKNCELTPEVCKTVGLEILASQKAGAARCFLAHFGCMELLHSGEYADAIIQGILCTLPFGELKDAYRVLDAHIPRFEGFLGSFLLRQHPVLRTDLLIYLGQKGICENALLQRNLLLWAVGLSRLGAEFPQGWHKMLLNWRDEPSRYYLSDVVAQKQWGPSDVTAISGISKDYQLPALLALALPEEERPYFYRFLELLKDAADFGTDSRMMLHLLKTLQVFCHWVIDLNIESETWQPVCDKLLAIANSCKQASRKLTAKVLIPELFAMQILVLSDSIEHSMAPWRNPQATFHTHILSTLARYVPQAYPQEGLRDKYAATFGKWRRSESIFLLGSRIRAGEDARLAELFRVFVASVFDEQFNALRRSKWLQPRLASFIEEHAVVWETWSQYECKEANVTWTEDPCDLLLMGTEIEKSCLAVSGELPNLAGLLGNIMNANAKMLAVKDPENGTLLARRVVRLGICEGTCALFLERFYGQPFYKDALLAAARKLSERLGINTYVAEVAGCRTGHSFVVHEGIVQYVYSDAAALRAGEPVISQGEVVIPDVECLFSQD